jgi:thiol-disulfide isomerase/thioredoxin
VIMEQDRQNLYSPYSGVLELSQGDFKKKKLINKDFKGKQGILIFYAPWCGHCRSMVREISELAIQFRYIFPFGTVNCENPNNNDICQEFAVEKFPTIFVTKNGKVRSYNGSRQKDDLLEYIYSETL